MGNTKVGSDDFSKWIELVQNIIIKSNHFNAFKWGGGGGGGLVLGDL